MAFAVASSNTASSSEIYPQAHDASSQGDSGAYFFKEDKPEENNPAKRGGFRDAHRF